MELTVAKIVNPNHPPFSRTKIFTNNRARALRLNRGVDFGPTVSDVKVVSYGRARLVFPADECWESFFRSEPLPEQFRKAVSFE